MANLVREERRDRSVDGEADDREGTEESGTDEEAKTLDDIIDDYADP